MPASSNQFTTTRSKIASVLGKLAPKSRKQTSNASAPDTEVEQELKSSAPEVDITSFLGLPMTSALRIFNAQRSTKVPFREPAGFPINQNFSQRVIYEFAHDEGIEAIFLTPYMRATQVFPVMSSSSKETKEVPFKRSTSSQPGETPTFLLGRPIRGVSTCRDTNMKVEVYKTIRDSIEDMLPRSHPDVPRVECPSMQSPLRATAVQVEARFPQTPYRSANHISNLTTPGLSYSVNTPSTAGSHPSPGDSTTKSSKEDMYFPRPIAHSFIPFPTSPTPPFSKDQVIHPFLLDPPGSVSQSSSYEGRSRKGYRPLGSEMMDTLDFLSHLCKRPGVLAGDGESLLDGDSDDDGLMVPFYHAI